MEDMSKRPEIVDDLHLEFLDALREEGITNMFGAVPYLTEEFVDLDEKEAKQILIYWMETFTDRHGDIY